MESEPLELPLDMIKASPGFALDIGGSMTKLIYRSKEDFQNGEPNDKELAAKGMGIVRQRLISREEIDEVISFIQEHCDITRKEDGDNYVYCTGVGSNLFQTKIDKQLNMKLKVLPELDCSAVSLTLLLKMKSTAELFEPVSHQGIKMAKNLAKFFKKLNGESDENETKFFVKDELEAYDPASTSRFPFILVMCGSGFTFIKVSEDKSPEFAEFCSLGGRTFLALVKGVAGVTDFDEISKLVEESDGRTVDMYGDDLIDPDIRDDIYSSLNTDFRAFPFGKLIAAQDKATQGDLVHSVMESISENVAMVAAQVAGHHRVPHIYFSGNFISTPKAQLFITKNMQVRRYMQKEDFHFEFIHNGGYLPAIGAFIKPYKEQKNAGV